MPAKTDETSDLPSKCPNCGKGPFVRDEESGELVAPIAAMFFARG